MKRLLVIEDTTENKISYYHIAVFLVALPFDKFYSELALISFSIHTTIHITRTKLRNLFSTQTLLLSSVFFVTLLGILYSPDKTDGLQNLEKQLAILLFPVLLSCCGLDLKKYLINFLLLFSFTCVITILYLYFDALHIIVYNKLPVSTLFSGVFINHNFSNPIDLHATYFAMYCGLSESILFYLFLMSAKRSQRALYLAGIIVLLAGLLQLASRSVLISGVVVALSFPFLLPKRAARTEVLIIAAGVLLIAGILIVNVSSFKMRYVAQLKNDLTQQSINSEVLEPRITRWKYTLALVERSPVAGYGSGSGRELLNQTYFEHKLYNSYLHELNSHNQYLGFLLETGLWGLCIFMFTLSAGFILAIRQRNLFFLSFLIIISIVSFSENILDANKGIFFYSFFFSLFVLSGKPFERLSRFKGRPGRAN